LPGVSSEKHDMNCERNDTHRPEGAPVIKLRRVATLDLPLRCVRSGHPNRDHRCEHRIPFAVVSDAWQRELERDENCAGFFQFSWQGEMWLGYGLPDGTLRGVYCPEHRAEREQRLGYDPELVVNPELVLTAAAASSAG
jgi:hypothetical protein